MFGGLPAVDRTLAGLRLAVADRRSRWLGVTAGLVYLALYLVALGHLSVGDGSFGLLIIDDPLSRLLVSRGGLSFGTVATVDLGVLSLLVAPVNLAIGVALTLLVGANVALTSLVRRRPQACGVERDESGGRLAGFVSGLPALLSGSACCGPALALVLGLQVTGVLLTAVQVLVPLAALGLVASLAYVARGIDPATVAG